MFGPRDKNKVVVVGEEGQTFQHENGIPSNIINMGFFGDFNTVTKDLLLYWNPDETIDQVEFSIGAIANLEYIVPIFLTGDEQTRVIINLQEFRNADYRIRLRKDDGTTISVTLALDKETD